MKRLVSFSLFVTIVIIALLAKNTANAQEIVAPAVVGTSGLVQPICPVEGYAVVRGRWAINRHPHIHKGPFFRHAIRIHARPVRYRRYRW